MTSDEIIGSIKGFSQNEWNSYVRQLLLHPDPFPSLLAYGDDFPSQIMWLYRKLIRDRLNSQMLEKAIIVNLKTIYVGESTGQQIYDLLYLIDEMRPVHEREEIKAILNEGRFKDLWLGEDNVHLILIKNFIFLEEKGAPLILDHVLNLKGNNDYSIYIGIFYLAYHGFEEKVFNEISSVLTTNIEFSTDFLISFYEVMIETIGEYFSIESLLTYIINNRIFINAENKPLLHCVWEIISYLKLNLHPDYLPQILFLQDIFQQNDKNFYKCRSEFTQLSYKSQNMATLLRKYYFPQNGEQVFPRVIKPGNLQELAEKMYEIEKSNELFK